MGIFRLELARFVVRFPHFRVFPCVRVFFVCICHFPGIFGNFRNKISPRSLKYFKFCDTFLYFLRVFCVYFRCVRVRSFSFRVFCALTRNWGAMRSTGIKRTAAEKWRRLRYKSRVPAISQHARPLNFGSDIWVARDERFPRYCSAICLIGAQAETPDPAHLERRKHAPKTPPISPSEVARNTL